MSCFVRVRVPRTKSEIEANAKRKELLRNFKNEPALGDLQQFLSGSGMFNLCQIKPSLWAKIQKELKTEQFAPDGSYRMNPQLGQFIE